MKVGKGCNICCNIMNTEPYLISIGENTTISGSVGLITHDNSIQKVLKDKTDYVGPITIGSNCFIGAGTLVLLGVTLADNIIVAAGSVVTKDVAPYTIVGGAPAHFIKNRFSEDQLERHIQTTEGDDSPLLVSAKGGDSIAR